MRQRQCLRTRVRWLLANEIALCPERWINPVYELLTKNNREWKTVLLEYEGPVDAEIVKELVNFIELMDLALINTEKVDSEFEGLLNADLAASMGSSYLGDRTEAKKNTTFAYWVHRATWAGADLTQITFGMPIATDQQISIEKVSSLISEAESLIQKDNLSKLVKKYKTDKKRLMAKLRRIKELIT